MESILLHFITSIRHRLTAGTVWEGLGGRERAEAGPSLGAGARAGAGSGVEGAIFTLSGEVPSSVLPSPLSLPADCLLTCSFLPPHTNQAESLRARTLSFSSLNPRDLCCAWHPAGAQGRKLNKQTRKSVYLANNVPQPLLSLLSLQRWSQPLCDPGQSLSLSGPQTPLL